MATGTATKGIKNKYAAGGRKFVPPSGREHPPAGKGQSVGGVHSAGGSKAAKPAAPFKNLSR